MANVNTSAVLLDECVEAALNLGVLQARKADTTEATTQLGEAIDAYVASLWYMPESERPTAREITIVMIRNAYLAFRFELGELPLEKVPEAFKVLENLYPNK